MPKIPHIFVCFRIHNTTNQVIAAFKNVRDDTHITTVTGTYIDDLTHADIELDALLYETRPARMNEYPALLALLKEVYEIEHEGLKAWIKPVKSLEDRSKDIAA